MSSWEQLENGVICGTGRWGFPPECPALSDFLAPLPPHFLSGSWRPATEREGMGTDGKENMTASCLPCPLHSPCHFLFEVCSWWTNRTSAWSSRIFHSHLSRHYLLPQNFYTEAEAQSRFSFLPLTPVTNGCRHLKVVINGEKNAALRRSLANANDNNRCVYLAFSERRQVERDVVPSSKVRLLRSREGAVSCAFKKN